MNSVVLLIVDGLGVGKRTQSNPFFQVATPTFDWLKANFPYQVLQASGIAVGLPWGDPGSSEVGHLTMGAGKVVYQNYPRITMAIRDGSFYQNPGLSEACAYVKQKGSRLHLVGLFSQSKTNASLDHFEAILKLARGVGVGQVLIHAITDGKESLPQQAGKLLGEVERLAGQIGVGRFASVAGRYYAMDGNEYWDRTEQYANLLIRGGKTCENYEAALQKAYHRNLTDEFVEPCLVGTDPNSSLIQEGDAVILWNFREDGLRQLALCLAPAAPGSLAPVHVPLPPNVPLVCLVRYDSQVSGTVAFAPPVIDNPLSQIISVEGKRQLKLAESLKGQLVTYYFNGLRSEAFPNEYQVIIPSDKVVDLAKGHQMKTEAVLDRFATALDEKIYDFICINIANLDVVGHQTDMDIALKTIQYVDGVVNRICRAALAANATLIITADHGNLEQMFDPMTGQPNTKHTDNPVPLWIVDKAGYGPRRAEEIVRAEKEANSSLANIAGIVLAKLGLKSAK